MIPYSDEFKAEVLATYKVDGQAAAARKHGVAKRTVQNWAKAAGVCTEAATKSATEAACNALEVRRARIREKLAARAEELLDRVASANGETPKDVRDLVWSFGVLLDKLRLEAGEVTSREAVEHDYSKRSDADLIAEAEAILRDAAQSV